MTRIQSVSKIGELTCIRCRVDGDNWIKHFKTTKVQRVIGFEGIELSIYIDNNSNTIPSIWLGNPNNRIEIKIESLIDEIIESVSNWRSKIIQRTDDIINLKENIRDWKIKKLIN